MANFVVIDTSIYRELGLKFYENIDYKNLYNFTIATDSEVLISTIVIEEFTNYYRQQLQKKFGEYKNAVGSLNRDPFFEKVEFLDISDKIEKSVVKFRKQLRSDPVHNAPVALLKHTLVDSLQLTKFILESKNQGTANIQVRDYLIWESIISQAVNESEDRVEKFGKRKIKFEKGIIYFITKDRIFEENELFITRKKQVGISNIKIFNSIPQFLHEKGYNIPFVTEELILIKVTNEKILKDLSRDFGSLLSYVSPRYDAEECDRRKVESAEIIDKEILEFYSYIDNSDSKPKYVAHLKVLVKVVFEKDNNYDKESGPEYGRYVETYDAKGRPVYNAPILFIYRGVLDTERQTIRSVQFIDFMPDIFI